MTPCNRFFKYIKMGLSCMDMAKVKFTGFVSTELTKNVELALPPYVKTCSKALLASNVSLTDYLNFFNDCNLENDIYRATKGRLTVEMLANQFWFRFHEAKAQLEYSKNVKHRDLLASILNDYKMTQDQYDFLNKRYFMPLQLMVEWGENFHSEASAFFHKLHETQMNTSSDQNIDELVAKYAFGSKRLRGAERDYFLEQIREKISNFEGLVLKNLIDENAELKENTEKGVET